MKGLEIAKEYWLKEGFVLLEEKFPQVMPLIAVGLVGSGSECYGFDDEISVDHDFEQGFCIFLPDESIVDRRTAFLLERAYATLPKEFMGLKRLPINPAGGNRHGVMRTQDFYRQMTGLSQKPQTWQDWLSIPEYALAEAVNGEIFFDGYGEFSDWRETLKNPPRDIRFKKLCGYLIAMSQTGEYNYFRCQKRNDEFTAMLTAAEFVNNCMGVVYWINNKPMPYYKWRYKGIAVFENTAVLRNALINILEHNDTGNNIQLAIAQILQMIEQLNIPTINTEDLQKCAVSLNNGIKNNELRSLSLLSAI